MTIATLNAYKGGLLSTGRSGEATTMQGPMNMSSLRWHDMWAVSFPLPAIPTTAVAPNNTTSGAMALSNAAGSLSPLGVQLSTTSNMTIMLVDRLSHQGGLLATTTTEQTTNLPTAALTRYTTGEGVMLALTLYANIGSTATTVTARYTNQAGTPNRVTTATTFGGFTAQVLGRAIFLPLQAGDTGVRSVEAVTVLASTGTSGNFGVTLYRPLVVVPAEVDAQGSFLMGGLLGGIPNIVNGACLSTMCLPSSTVATFPGQFALCEH